MFASKQLGYTLLLSSLLAACATAPKPPVDKAEAVAAGADANEPDLEKLAKERAAQGPGKSREASREKAGAAGDTSESPELTGISAEQKSQARPVLDDYRQAIVLMRARQLDDAFQQFEAIQAKAPALAGPLLNQALIRIQQNNYADAEALLKKAQGVNDKNPYLYNLQGYVYRHLGKFADARAAYEKALAISPKYAKAHFNLGVLNDLYAQDLPLALQSYEAYQGLQPTPDAVVGKWIIDLQKRTGVYKPPVKPAASEEITVEETPPPAEATAQPESAPAVNTAPAPDADKAAQEAAPTTTVMADSSGTAATTSASAAPAPAEAAPAQPDAVADKPKKAGKSRKQGRKVKSDTATPATDTVKSPATENAPPASPAPASTTAAGVQP